MNFVATLIRKVALPASICGALVSSGAVAQAAAHSGIGVNAPLPAAAAGFKTLTFSTMSNFRTGTVDMGLTQKSGYQWYFCNLYGTKASSATTTLNADGSVTFASFANNANCGMTSITQTYTAPYFKGTAFGGGAYFEATLAFNPATINTATGWPSWWTMSVEHLNGDHGDQWPGQATGYTHFMEPDIFEANLGPYGLPANVYNGSMHDWYGVWNKTCSAFCQVSSSWNTNVRYVPSGTNFNNYHRYGLLWVTATATTPGSFTYYFDGVQVGPKVTYTKYTGQAPKPTTSTPWTFGEVDQQHLVLILGTGASTPMKVQSVQVWQASAAGNQHY